MSDIELERTQDPNPSDDDATEPGALILEEKPQPDKAGLETSRITARSSALLTAQARERPGTAEHLAARRPQSELDADSPQIKERLIELRSAITRLVTGLRWGGQSLEETTEQMIPLLNVGPVPQWKSILIPFLLEIDRAGNLIPVWLKIIERSDPQDLPAGANPAETMIGRARRFAILMLGNYKYGGHVDQEKAVGFSRIGLKESRVTAEELVKTLRKLATDPNTSLYATQALVKQGTTASLQALMSALREAEGWARVDVVEACLSLQQERFYDLLVGSGLERAGGLESYIAIPIYRAVPLDHYLHGSNGASPRLAEQAALIFVQVLQDSMKLSARGEQTVPPVFDGDLSTVATALFEGARRSPNWQKALALHRLGLLLGRYWASISRKEIQEDRIVEPIYRCLPMMPDVERWMAGPGRDVLLEALADSDMKPEAALQVVRVLGELREPRAISTLINRINTIQQLDSRQQALSVGAMCDTLGLLGDRRAAQPMVELVQRTVDVERRAGLPQRRDNLPQGDADIPGSIVYAAAVRACGQLGDPAALESVLRAAGDFDPYVRTQAMEAIKRLDPTGSDPRSRAAVRAALNDPYDALVRAACQQAAQYRDGDAVPTLEHITETRPELAVAAYDALRQIRQ
jgi:HEAT repeat protein